MRRVGAGFTTTEVIRRSGRSTGALYNHFATKADLLEATVAHVFAQLRAGFVAALETQPESARTLSGMAYADTPPRRSTWPTPLDGTETGQTAGG